MASVSLTDASKHEHTGEFSNYDVLLAKNHMDSLILDPAQTHIGNNRFQILSNMHRDEFDERLTAGENTDVVVNKIIDIVCRQCEPKGRFMLTEGKGSWIILNQGETRHFVTEFLAASPDRVKLTPPEALTNSLPAPIRSSDADGAPHPPQELRSTMAGGAGEERKRRRRSSLLRRSVSEGNFDDKKKLGRLLGKLPTLAMPSTPSWIPSIGRKTKPEGLDVLFNRTRTKLSPGPTGNNRLAITIKMQQNSYMSSSAEERQRIAVEVYNTVTKAWKGRFLAENLNRRGYAVLTTGEAVHAICCLFDPRYAFDPAGYAMATTYTMPLSIAEDAGEDGPSAAFDLKQPAAVKEVTMQAIHSLSAETDDASGIHSAALASLQKRRQKQDLNSRLRRMTSGSPHPGVAATTHLHRHASAPVPMTSFERVESDASFASLTPIPLPGMASSSVSLPSYDPSSHSFGGGAYPQQHPYNASSSLAAIGGEPSLPDLPHPGDDPALLVMEPRPIHPHRDPSRVSMNPIRLTGSGVGTAGEIDAGLLEDLLSHLDMSGDLHCGGGGMHNSTLNQNSGGGENG
jgi:hypothetical protein